MKTLVCTQPGSFEYQEIEKPEPKEGFAIIKVQRIGICGTDLHAFQGNQPFFAYPRILGHELSGVIDQIESGTDFSIGEQVTLIPYFSCGTCVACRGGKPNCCTDIAVFGVHVDGGMKEFISVPVRALVKSQGLALDELALVEPLAIGAHAIRRAAVTEGEWVLVVGAGPIGLGTIEFARIAGARVIVLDVNDDRLRFCREKLGVANTINAQAPDVYAQLMQITGGDMPTVVIDATGNLGAIQTAFQYLAHSGRLVMVGLQKQAISFSHPEFHKREATLMSSRNALRADFDHVIASIKSGKVNLGSYITHRVEFADVAKEFSSWLDPANKVIKAIIKMDKSF